MERSIINPFKKLKNCSEQECIVHFDAYEIFNILISTW